MTALGPSFGVLAQASSVCKSADGNIARAPEPMRGSPRKPCSRRMRFFGLGEQPNFSHCASKPRLSFPPLRNTTLKISHPFRHARRWNWFCAFLRRQLRLAAFRSAFYRRRVLPVCFRFRVVPGLITFTLYVHGDGHGAVFLIEHSLAARSLVIANDFFKHSSAFCDGSMLSQTHPALAVLPN